MPVITFDLFTLIITFAVAHGYFLSFIIFRNRTGNRKANRFFALLLVAISFSMTSSVLIKTKLYQYFPHLTNTPMNVIFLMGPLFYFYVRIQTTAHYKFQPKDGLHFLPFVTAFFYYLPFYLKSGSEKMEFLSTIVFNNTITPKYYPNLVILVFGQMQVWIYLFFIQRVLKKHEQQIRQVFSNIEEVTLAWIQFFLKTFVGVYIGFFIVFLIMLKMDRFQFCYDLVTMVIAISLFGLSYRALKQPEIFLKTEPLKTNAVGTQPLSKRMAVECLKTLHELMETEKLYANPELNLSDLAKQIAVSRNTLSQVINDHAGMNFYDFINQYRIEEVKRLLQDEEKNFLTIEALAEEAGFKSKSSFHRAFKKFTEMTPTQYRNLYTDPLTQTS